jgi:hypothetical protein
MDVKQARGSHATMHPTWHAELTKRLQEPHERWDHTPAGVTTATSHRRRSAH